MTQARSSYQNANFVDNNEISKALVSKIICSNGRIFEMPAKFDAPSRKRLDGEVEEFDQEPLNL